MTTTYTTTSTFTRTHARYLASKIAADLFQMKLFYGRPNDKQIETYVEEVVVLLLGGHLESVSYGFKRGEKWVVALNYSVRTGGILMNDDRSGRIVSGIDISGASWYSFLRYSQAFLRLAREEQEKVEALLPFKRSEGEEPKVVGAWVSDKSYASGGVSLQRGTFTS